MSTEFLLPPGCAATLDASISHFRLSLSLTTDPQLLIDATFNLAEALLSRAELREDQGEVETPVDEGRREAVELLKGVATEQEKMLAGLESSGAEEVTAEELVQGEDEVMDTEGDTGEDGAPEASSKVWEQTGQHPLSSCPPRLD